jgi:peptidoglycan/xylan/chitin deacetylase (PgdA/CDA1 family)
MPSVLLSDRQLLQTGLRVLMFHDVQEASNRKNSGIYKMDLVRFKDIIECLSEIAAESDLHFTTLASSSTRGMVLTFDDGLRSIADLVFPLLESLGIPFHIFVSTEAVAQESPRHLSPQLIRELSNSGFVSIGSHGHEHVALTSLKLEDARRNLMTSKHLLEDWTEKRVDSLSYPHGRYSSAISQMSKSVGFRFACTSLPGTFLYKTDQLAIPRMDIWSIDRPFDVKGKLAGNWNRALRFAFLRNIND